MEIVIFNQTVAGLQEIVESTKGITATDLKDKAQLTIVKDNRTLLRRIEIEIEKQGKEQRDEANKYAKEVITREKELKEITSPEIARLKSIEDEAKKLEIREERLTDLPHKKEKLSKIGDSIEITDDELLEMDYEQFMVYHNQRIADKLEADRAKLDAEKDKLEEDKRLKEIQDKAKADAEQKLKEQQALKEKEDKAEADKLEADKKYQSWLAENGYNEKEFIIRKESDKIILYKKVAEFIPEGI